MQEIRGKTDLLAIYIPSRETISKGSRFFCSDDDFIQFATHGYEKGKVVLPHQHRKEPRPVDKTQEVLVIVSGSLRADIYDYDQQVRDSVILNKGDIIVLLAGGHGFTMLSDDTHFLEIKNGPYLGAERDRFRLFERR